MSDNVDVVQVLVQRLRVESDDLLCSDIISVLGRIGDPSALEVLLSLADTEKGDILEPFITTAITRIHSDRSIDAQLKLLDSDEWVVVADAVVALGEYVVLGEKDDRILPKLIKLVEHSNASVREAVVAVLGRFGDAATEYVIAALDDPSSDVQTMAIKALGYVRNQASVDALVRVLETDNRRYCRLAISSLYHISLLDKLENVKE